MLHAEDRHEPLNAPAWDAQRARGAIARNVQDTEARSTPEALRPAHPQDDDDPARELMWGAPGALLAALVMHRHRSHEERGSTPYRATARKPWSQLEWSDGFDCHDWTQSLDGRPSTGIDAVHGFVATAVPLIHGRDLLEPDEWQAWQPCIANTVRKTAHPVHDPLFDRGLAAQ